MSVVNSGKTIFCEGKDTSLDYQLLSRVVEDISGDRLTIIPAGSKFTLSSFAQGYFFRTEENDVENQPYIIFRDRDFDAKPKSDTQLLQLENTNRSIFLTYRACIENYLLDSNLIHSYWTDKYREKQENPSSKWGHNDSPGIDKITEWIESSSKNLKYYQAVRWALGDLLCMSASRKQLQTTWTGASGKLPKSLELDNCKNEALGLVTRFRQAVESITEITFQQSLNTYLEQFEEEDFWEQKKYLIWFHGKDIQKEMHTQQSSYISLPSFFDYAIKHLDISQHSDLVELKQKIGNLKNGGKDHDSIAT